MRNAHLQRRRHFDLLVGSFTTVSKAGFEWWDCVYHVSLLFLLALPQNNEESEMGSGTKGRVGGSKTRHIEGIREM